MRGKAVLAVAALAAAGALVSTGAAGAGGGAETKVTIKAPGGEVYGKVKSPKPRQVRRRPQGDRLAREGRLAGRR